MAKLFTSILCKRVQGIVELQQPEEQYGFRAGRGCRHAVYILQNVAQKSEEWGEELWLAALDVEKAFDRVHHAELLDCLLWDGIGVDVVVCLKNMYSDLRAHVRLNSQTRSRSFMVERGVRQGDPLSPVLFLVVIKHVLADLKRSWDTRGFGSPVGTGAIGDRITHTAFADDVTLIASSWRQLRVMLLELKARLGDYGLNLHQSKS